MPLVLYTMDTVSPSSILNAHRPNSTINQKSILTSTDKVRKAKSSKSVYFDQFLEINCSYLCPNDMDDNFMSRESSEFVAFHNNVRSMNQNFDKVHDVFQNCSRKPDILVFSDTQIRETSKQKQKT